MKIKPKPRPFDTLNSSTQEHMDHFIAGTEVGTSAHQKDSWNIELGPKTPLDNQLQYKSHIVRNSFLPRPNKPEELRSLDTKSHRNHI